MEFVKPLHVIQNQIKTQLISTIQIYIKYSDSGPPGRTEWNIPGVSILYRDQVKINGMTSRLDSVRVAVSKFDIFLVRKVAAN